MISFINIVRNWKLIAIIALVLAMTVTIIRLRSAYREEERKVWELKGRVTSDSVKILDLEREIIYFKEDTAQLRYSIKRFDANNQQEQKKDKDKNKGLSSKLPSLDQVKNK